MRACPKFAGIWSHRFQERGLALYFLANDKLTPFAFDAPKIQRVHFQSSGKCLQVHAPGWHRLAACRAAHVGAPRCEQSGVKGERRRQALNVPNAVKVSVSDTGPGIRPEFHLEIFDDFFRLPGSESAEGMGLGLGHRPPSAAGHGREDLGGKRTWARAANFLS